MITFIIAVLYLGRDKSAHAYLPKINGSVEIEPQDLAPDFKIHLSIGFLI